MNRLTPETSAILGRIALLALLALLNFARPLHAQSPESDGTPETVAGKFVPAPRDEIKTPMRVELPLRKTSAEDYQISQKCDTGEISGRACKVNWVKASVQALEVTIFDNAWNITTDKWVRSTVFNNRDFVGNWFQSVENFKFSRWYNGDWFVAAYIGHPMQGAIFSDTWIHNDPRGKSLELENTRRYWRSRMRAMAWSAFWTLQWRFGPLSEASFGNTGLYTYYSPDIHRFTNDTGFVTLVTTPVGGAIWGVGEDAIDKYIVKKVEARHNHVVTLLGLSMLTPSKSFANFTRFKAFWYRDSRPVKAHIFREKQVAQQSTSSGSSASTPN